MLHLAGIMIEELHAAFAEFEVRLDRKLDARFAQVDARFAQVDAQLAQLGARVDEGKSHTHVLIGGLRDEVRLVYDGVIGLNERVGTLEARVDAFETRVERRFDELSATFRPGASPNRRSPRRRR